MSHDIRRMTCNSHQDQKASDRSTDTQRSSGTRSAFRSPSDTEHEVQNMPLCMLLGYTISTLAHESACYHQCCRRNFPGATGFSGVGTPVLHPHFRPDTCSGETLHFQYPRQRRHNMAVASALLPGEVSQPKMAKVLLREVSPKMARIFQCLCPEGHLCSSR